MLTNYGCEQYTDVDNIRTLTIYGRCTSPYIVKSVYCQRPKRKSVYCKRPYIEKIAVSQDIVTCASPYRVTPKTIYGLANVRILFFDHCDVYTHTPRHTRTHHHHHHYHHHHHQTHTRNGGGGQGGRGEMEERGARGTGHGGGARGQWGNGGGARGQWGRDTGARGQLDNI